MTKIKLCGLTRPCDIEAANALMPDYIGFVFSKKSKRYVSPETALALKKLLHPSIAAVGVFVREEPEAVAELLERGIIDIAQLHGGEDEDYIRRLHTLTDKPLIQAFRMEDAPQQDAAHKGNGNPDGAPDIPAALAAAQKGSGKHDAAPDTLTALAAAQKSSADFVLFDSGNGGTGTAFNWSLLENAVRPYFLAGGLDCDNVAEAVRRLAPYAVDVSSGIETDGKKDREKMERFVRAVRAVQG